VTTSDPGDVEPGDNTLVGGTQGFSVTPATAGALTVTATDTSNGAITPGISSAITVYPTTVVTQALTLDYEMLGVTNGAPIPNPYPGISTATVTHFGTDQHASPFEDVIYWAGVSPGNGYGNLTNVAVGPRGNPSSVGLTNPAWGVISIAPNYAGSSVRLVSFELASLDDDAGGDEVITGIYVHGPAPYDVTYWFAAGISIAGDVNNGTNRLINFSGIPVQGPVDETLTIWWEAHNGRVAVDNVRFEVVGPRPPVILSFTGAETGQVVVTWSAISNRTYRLLYTDDLGSGNWVSHGPDITALGPTASATNFTDHATQRLYRLLLLP